MDGNLDELLNSLTDRQRKVVRAFVATPEHAPELAERTGLSIVEVEETLEELIEIGLIRSARFEPKTP